MFMSIGKLTGEKYLKQTRRKASRDVDSQNLLSRQQKARKIETRKPAKRLRQADCL